MKSYAIVIFIVACLAVQETKSAPDMQDRAQEMLDKVKAKAQEAVEHAQEVASKAVDAARSAVQDAMEAAQQATQQGIETGHEWIEYGKSVAASFSNQTSVDKVEEEN